MLTNSHRRTISLTAAAALVLSSCSGGFTQAEVDDAIATAVAAAVETAEAEAGVRAESLEAELAEAGESLADVTGELEVMTAERDRLEAELAELSTTAGEGGGTGAATGDPAAVVGGELVVVSDGLVLPTAAAGQVEVVVFQALGERRVGVTVHNNTGGQVSGVEVTATVRDSAGTLAGSASESSFFPKVLEDGQAAVAELFFRDGTPVGGSIEFTVDWSSGDVHSGGIFPSYRLPLVEWAISSSQLVGRVGNPLEVPVRLVRIGAGCFSSDGAMLWYSDTFADRDEIPAGADSPFSMRTPGSCDLLIIASSGWEA